MRVRKLVGFGQGVAVNGGDYSFGANADDFWVDDATGVAQSVLTSLMLHQGEWFLDITVGMPWETQVEGFGTGSLYDAAIKNCILGVEGVQSIEEYSSSLDTSTRNLTVDAILNTVYGPVPIEVTL